MSDLEHPDLRRAVWLTAAQRYRLRVAADKALLLGVDETRVSALLGELALVDERSVVLGHLVRGIVNGLRLPEDALPVHLTDAQCDVLIDAGCLDADFARLIRPAPESYDIANYLAGDDHV